MPIGHCPKQVKTRFILFRSHFKVQKSINSTGNGPEVDFRRKLGLNRAQKGLLRFEKSKNLTGNRPEVDFYLIQKWSSRLQKCDSNLAKIDIRNESDLSLLFIISPKCKIVRFPYFLILTDLYRKFFVKSNSQFGLFQDFGPSTTKRTVRCRPVSRSLVLDPKLNSPWIITEFQEKVIRLTILLPSYGPLLDLVRWGQLALTSPPRWRPHEIFENRTFFLKTLLLGF